MRTSEVAALAQVNAQTLRYYERRGLLAEPARTGAGYRAYGQDAVEVVRFIKRAQQLGFTLDEVEELLGLAAGGPAGCSEASAMAVARLTDLQCRIDELVSMRDALVTLAATCGQPRSERDCPILQCLQAGRSAGDSEECR